MLASASAGIPEGGEIGQPQQAAAAVAKNADPNQQWREQCCRGRVDRALIAW
jgi:hypothetical protein